MRVLHVLPFITARAGGPVAFAAEAAEALGDFGVHCTIFSTDLGHVPSLGERRAVEPHELPASAKGLDLRLFSVKPPQRFVFSPALAREVEARVSEFDLLHVHSLWLHPQYAACVAAHRSGVPYIVSPHGALDPLARRHRPVRKLVSSALWQTRMLRHARLLHVTTAQEGERSRNVAPGVPREILPVGIWNDRLRTLGDARRFRESHLRGHRGPIVLFLGRLSFKKGIDTLIRAFARALTPDDTRLVIAGPDDEGLRPSLESIAHAEGVVDRVSFLGPLYRQDRADALAAATVWALASRFENFGVAVMEALAVGVPTIVSTGVDLARDVESAGAGLVVAATPDSFAEALSRLMLDEALQHRLSSAAHGFASGYDWSAVAPRMRRMYERALAHEG